MTTVSMRARRWAVAAVVLLGSALPMAASRWGRTTVDASDRALTRSEGVLRFRGAPFTGRVVERYASGAIKSETEYRGGLRDGRATGWYPNGRRMYARSFTRGREDGTHTGWWENGERHFVYHYAKGALEGNSKEWYADGHLYRDFNYVGGQEEGAQRMWWPDGRIRASYVVRDGRRYGLMGSKGCVGTAAASGRASSLPYFTDSTLTPRWIAQDSPTLAGVHRIADFSLVDQDGKVVTAADLDGKITVASFFLTTCTQVCPLVRSELARVQEAFASDTTVMLLSHTVQPEHDDVGVLAHYAHLNGIRSGKWHLLTGERPRIAALAHDSYFVELTDTSGYTTGNLRHTETIVLVDAHRRIRGLYHGTLAYDVEKLIEDIRALRAER